MFIPLAFINRFHQFHGRSISRHNHNHDNIHNYEFGDNLFCDIVIVMEIIILIIAIILVILLIKELIADYKSLSK